MEINDVIKLLEIVNASYHREPPRYTIPERTAMRKIISKIAPAEKHILVDVLERLS